jgi:hypothetical protein
MNQFLNSLISSLSKRNRGSKKQKKNTTTMAPSTLLYFQITVNKPSFFSTFALLAATGRELELVDRVLLVKELLRDCLSGRERRRRPVEHD